MPNAFTPSGDGQNDMLKIFASGITNYRLIIRDRAGIKIFDSDNREREWYGENAKGSRKVRSDNYAYLLEYTTVAGKNYTRKGKVSLINNEELSDFLAEHCIENYNDCVFGQMWQGDTLPLKPLSLAGEYFPECN